jgi:hypothetical protein
MGKHLTKGLRIFILGYTRLQEGGPIMSIFKAEARFGWMVAVVLAVLIAGGCAKGIGIKYSYDIKSSFSGLSTYNWEPSTTPYRQDYLLETNVQFLADQTLEKRGFNRTAEKPELLISMSYEHEVTVTKYNYQLRVLTLNIYKSENKELIWQGTASGPIKTDAASEDLRQAVQDVLSNFPPR